MISLDDAVKVAKSLVAGGKDDDAIIRQEMAQKCRNDAWSQQVVSAVAESMNKVISGINSTEICNQIVSDNLRNWCERTQCKLRIAMNYLPYQGKALSSAQPERKKGKWIDAVIPNDNGGLPVQVCDQCNTFFPLAYTGGGHRFCPNCGADMRGGEDERPD